MTCRYLTLAHLAQGADGPAGAARLPMTRPVTPAQATAL